MRALSSTRCFLLAVACVSAFQTACTTDGGMVGMAPEGSRSAPKSNGNGDSNTGSGQSSSAADAVSSGDFAPLINKGGVAACMSITEKDVPINYWETVGLGAVVGTVLLALVGAAAGAVLTGGQGDGAAAGAIAGAAMGAGLGTADGVQTAEQKQRFAVQMARYDCQIQAADMENGSLKGAGERLQASVGALSRQLDQLEQDYANKRLTRAQAQKELNDIDDAAASLKHRLVAMNEDTDKFEQYAASTEQLAQGTQNAIDQARVSALDSQIAEMTSRNANLEQDYNRLVERRKAIVLQ
jgi:hypothetical protein